MMQRFLASFLTTACALALEFVSLAAVPVATHAPKGALKTPPAAKTAKTWTPPRTPWGDPDLQGTWPGTAMMGVPLERPQQFGDRESLTNEEFDASEAQARRQAQADNEEFVTQRAPDGTGGAGNTGGPGHWGERGKPHRQTSLIVDPPDGRMPPMTLEGQKRTAAIPATLYYDNNGGGPCNGPEDLSVYDRCVTRGVVGSTLPSYTSDAVRLVEHFTRVDEDTIQYRVTIDDPKTWTRPWTIAFPLKQDPRYGMFEYAVTKGIMA